MVNVDLDRLILWLPLVIAAILGGSIAFPPEVRRPRTTADRKRHGAGMWMAAVGISVTLAGLWLWVTSPERRNQVVGTIVFLVGSAVAFVGLRLVDRAPRWREE